MKEQLRKIVREIMREKAISEMNEVSINEVDTKKANQIRKAAAGYVGPKFAKKASDEDILLMADLKDEKASLYNRYLKDIMGKISKLQKKYNIKESVNESKKLADDVYNALNVLHNLASVLYDNNDKRHKIIGKTIDTIERSINKREISNLSENESVNEGTDKKSLELIHIGLGKPNSMPNPVNVYRKWKSVQKKHKLSDKALGDYLTTYFKKEYEIARKFYMSESLNEGTDIYLNNKIQITKFSGGNDGKLIQINAPKIKGSGDHIVMKIDDFKKMLKTSSNLLKQIQESVNEGKKSKDSTGVRKAEAIHNNVDAIIGLVLNDKKDAKEILGTMGPVLINAIKATLNHKFKPAVGSEDSLKKFQSKLKDFLKFTEVLLRKPSKAGVKRLETMHREWWNWNHGADVVLNGRLTDTIIESVINEGYSTEEKRIVMMAVRKLSKYRSVPIDQSINDLLGAGAELQRDIKKGKIKK